MDTKEIFFTPEEVCEYLRISRSTLDRRKAQGIIPYAKIGGLIRFRKIDIDKWLKRISYKINAQGYLKPKLDLSIKAYARMHLKGDDSVLSKKRGRWNYGRKGVWRRKRKNGYTWYYWYYDENPKPKYVRVPDATCFEDAKNELDSRVEQIRRKNLKVKSITLKEFAPIYLEKYAVKKRSWKSMEKMIKGRLIPYFGDMLLAEITPEHVSDFVVNFKPKVDHVDEVKGSAINKHIQVLSRMFNIARKFGYETGENPVDRELHFADETQFRRNRVLSLKEESQLMNESAKHLQPIIQCILLQGLRPGKETLNLKVTDIDLKSEIPTLLIRSENSKSGNEEIIPIRLKMIPIFKRLITENSGRSEYVFNYQEPFTEGQYRPITTCRRAFDAACRRADIHGLQLRDLRRTSATRLHEAGVDPLVIKRFMRHSSTGITEKVYIQSSLKMMKQALDDVDREPIYEQMLRQFTTNLRQKQNMPTNEKQVTCLFSTN